MGALLAFALLIALLVWPARKQHKQAADLNAVANGLLEKRNKIGEVQANALETIAEWCRHNWEGGGK